MSVSNLEVKDTMRSDGSDEPDPIIHHWCCDPKRTLCGIKLSTSWIATVDGSGVDEDSCALCVHMIESGAECSPGCNERHGISS